MNRKSRYCNKRGLPYYERLKRNRKFQDGFLWCAECEQYKPIDQFYPNGHSITNYGYRFYCIECENYRKRNKPLISRRNKKRNSKLKRQFVELAGKACQRCGYDEFFGSLEFHHIYRKEKEYTPGPIIYSNDFEAAWQELDKCCLLCSNCHRGYESGEWRAEFVKRNGLGWTVGKTLQLDDSRYETQPDDLETEPVPERFKKPKIRQLSFFLQSGK